MSIARHDTSRLNQLLSTATEALHAPVSLLNAIKGEEQREGGAARPEVTGASNADERSDEIRMLRAREERYRLAVHAANTSIWDYDIASGALEWNGAAARMLRYTPDEIGTSIEWWYERVHPLDRPRTRCSACIRTSGRRAVLTAAGWALAW